MEIILQKAQREKWKRMGWRHILHEQLVRHYSKTSYFDLAVTRARVTRASPTFTATNTPSSVLQRTRARVYNVATTHGPPEKTFYRTGVIIGSEYSMRVSASQAPLALAVSLTLPNGGPDHLQNKI